MRTKRERRSCNFEHFTFAGRVVAGLKSAEKEAKDLIPTLEEMTSNIDELGVATARHLQLTLSESMKKDQRQIDILNIYS